MNVSNVQKKFRINSNDKQIQILKITCLFKNLVQIAYAFDE